MRSLIVSAKLIWQLSREQIMTLKPVTIETNKYRVEMRLYNKADVEDLKARVGGAVTEAVSRCAESVQARPLPSPTSPTPMRDTSMA